MSINLEKKKKLLGMANVVPRSYHVTEMWGPAGHRLAVKGLGTRLVNGLRDKCCCSVLLTVIFLINSLTVGKVGKL